MDKLEALEVWKREMGNKEYAYDFSGKKIKREDYNVANQVGWVINYIKPIELGGPTHDGNVIIMHHRTYDEKGLNYPYFSIVDKSYVARYDEKGDYYYIEENFDEIIDEEEE